MPDISRRRLIELGIASIAATGLGAVALTQHASARPPLRARNMRVLSEWYKGRRIHIDVQAGSATLSSFMSTVFIDGMPLHIMRTAEGEFTSMLHHYETFPSLRAIARAAVDRLKGDHLIPFSH